MWHPTRTNAGPGVKEVVSPRAVKRVGEEVGQNQLGRVGGSTERLLHVPAVTATHAAHFALPSHSAMDKALLGVHAQNIPRTNAYRHTRARRQEIRKTTQHMHMHTQNRLQNNTVPRILPDKQVTNAQTAPPGCLCILQHVAVWLQRPQNGHNGVQNAGHLGFGNAGEG